MDRTSRPSVPGRMPIHSSAIAEYPVRIGLIASGEERELLGIGRPDRAQPLRRGAQRLVPLDLAEFSAAARTGANEGLAQPRRRVVLHDTGGALGAEHAPVDGMAAIALDVADCAPAEADLDA